MHSDSISFSEFINLEFQSLKYAHIKEVPDNISQLISLKVLSEVGKSLLNYQMLLLIRLDWKRFI